MPPTTGVIEKGPHRGWLWEVFRDPDSPTGWTRKIWNPRDTSAGGKPVEYFEDEYEHPKLVRKSQEKQAKRVASSAAAGAAETRRQAVADQKERSDAAWLDNVSTESRRRFDSTADYNERTRVDKLNEVKNALREQERQFNLTYAQDEREHGLNRDKFGLDILEAGAKLKGPADYFQGASFARGVSGAGLAPYLTAFSEGRVPGYGGGTRTTGHPEPLTLNSLVKDMTGQPGAGLDSYGRPLLRPDQQRAIDVIGKKYEAGLANAKQGEIENLTEGELAAFKSGGSYLARAVDDEFELWRRSRPGQGHPLSG